MSLRSCNLRSSFPSKLIQLPTLQELDLSYNENLTGTLPEFPQGSALSEVVLSHTGFTGWLPDSIGNLSNLTRLALSSCNFSGPIPLTLGNLTDLVGLDLSSNSFSGSIPLFHKANKLYSIDLSTNNLTGPLTSAHFGSLDLVCLYLSENSITGTVPSVLLSLPSLQILYLRKNHFSGEVHEFDASFSVLEKLDLSSNHLNGSIPRSIFKLKRLSELLLSSNSFSGTIKIEVMKELPGLYWLDLSYNNLRIDVQGSNSTSFPFPQLSVIRLASCELQKFPDLTNQSSMLDLDLSLNNIKGQIPSWVWSVYYLNLSCNLLESLENPYMFTTLQFMDLHSNMINDNLPILPTSLTYLSLAKNKFTGSIPSSICNLDQLQFLDMSNNSLNNKIPPCLLQKTDLLVVLKLGRNKLSGVLADTFALNCNLKTLDLSNNDLEGKVPTSLERCAFLEVFDIGNNKIRDTFPCMLKKISSLHVIVLRLNRFHGNLQCPIVNNQTWSKLQIVDLSSNNFSGDLLPQYFSSWKGMILSSNSMQGHQHLQVDFIMTFYYKNTVTLNLKGQLVEILNIVEALTSIDFSCNNFQGEIPEVLGDLKLLYLLNFSHNALTGNIPKALGKLTQLESLDFSVNQLSGRIPDELASLTFLSVLNLSFNQLSGRIPSGNQLQTFSADSFEGNIGLCDFPLKKTCSETKFEHDEIDGKYISFALGSSVGFGIVIWLFLHCRRYNELVDRLLFRILGQHQKSGRNKNPRRSR
ncbi:receptor-like protein 50 [Lycium ferocissimum]|uniref:receptor-like protein 50 n=1 Tax=Lycium ferocissimum TaxID=112874 RepID=UPI002814EA4C|nr:receptor-like protein 50 [Lycium ferocissimum]